MDALASLRCDFGPKHAPAGRTLGLMLWTTSLAVVAVASAALGVGATVGQVAVPSETAPSAATPSGSGPPGSVLPASTPSASAPSTSAASISTAPAPIRSASVSSGPAPAAPAEHSELDALFASPTTRDHVGRVVVPVRINGRGPYRFIVDTGANHSTISPELVRALGLSANTKSLLTLDGITGTAQVSYVAIERLQAGDLTIENTAMPVVWAPVMGGADGILGAAGLEQKSLLIDFKRNYVAIAGHIDSNIRDQSTRIRASRIANGLMIMRTLVGGVQVDAVLDTGSERTLGNRALREALRGSTRVKQGFVAQLTSVYGATEAVESGEILAAPTISIGGLRITDVAIVYGDFHIFKVWDMQARPAMILGMDVLGTVASLDIDFKNQSVYVGSTVVQDRLITSPHDMSAVQSEKK